MAFSTLSKSGHYSLGFHVQLSKTTIKCDYKLKGHVLLLNLNSAGILKSEMGKLILIVVNFNFY